MANNGPDPSEFLEQAQRMLRELFGGQRSGDQTWAEATQGHRQLSPQEQRENLTFALATRAVEALEDLALNVAAIRQRLERLDPSGPGWRPGPPPADPAKPPFGPDLG
jgi:uncharacterized membrane protein YccC